MAAKLSDAKVRALRVLAAHDEVRESNTTTDAELAGHRSRSGPSIDWQTAKALMRAGLAAGRPGGDGNVWRITDRGRQTLQQHDAKTGGGS